MLMIDTDIVIDYLRHYKKGLDFINEHKNEIAISDFVEIELILGCRNKDEIRNLENLLKSFLL